MNETEIRKAICDLLASYPDRCIFRADKGIRRRQANQGKYLPTGWPDISGVWISELKTPFPLFIEVKKPGGAISEAQHNFLVRAGQMGCLAFVASSVEHVEYALGLKKKVEEL